MGIIGKSTGVTLRFVDAAGETEIQSPVTGQFSRFFAKERPESPGSTNVLFGSPDWLTDIILADSSAKLEELPPSQTEQAFTSASSKRVNVQYSVGNDQTKMINCLTIVNLDTSTQASATDPVAAQEIFVLPSDTDMKPGHPFFARWEAGANKSHAIKAAQAAQAAPKAPAGSQKPTPPAAKGSVA